MRDRWNEPRSVKGKNVSLLLKRHWKALLMGKVLLASWRKWGGMVELELLPSIWLQAWMSSQNEIFCYTEAVEVNKSATEASSVLLTNGKTMTFKHWWLILAIMSHSHQGHRADMRVTKLRHELVWNLKEWKSGFQHTAILSLLISHLFCCLFQ